jgi:pyridoxal phosphate enzyme (YggS family)
MSAAAPIADRLAAIRARVAEAARRAGRSPDEVTVVGVAKRHGPERVVEAVAAGLACVAESFAQEAREKIPLVREALARRGLAAPRFHFVGRLQTNKARLVAPLCDCVESVDRPELARELARRAEGLGRRLAVTLQVNVSGEAQKGGVAPDALPALLEVCDGLPALEVVGLMTVPEAGADEARLRRRFARLRELRDTAARAGRPGLRELSMGMSADFELAVEEGATWVRIGTALFGPREG